MLIPKQRNILIRAVVQVMSKPAVSFDDVVDVLDSAKQAIREQAIISIPTDKKIKVRMASGLSYAEAKKQRLI